MVEDYVAEFQRLSVMITDATENRLIVLFIEGLVEPLKDLVRTFDPLSLQEAIKKSLDLEEEEACVDEAKQNHDPESLGSTLATLSGAPRYHPFWVRGDLQVQRGTILIDCGATHSFIDESLVAKMDLNVEDLKGFTVKVANGYSMPCTRSRPNLLFTLGKHEATVQSVDLSAQIYWVPDSSASNYLNYGAAASEVEVDLLSGATTILQTDIIYDCGRSLNPAVDLGQIEGAFVQGVGFFMTEEHVVDKNGKLESDGTWTYKVPTLDTIPRKFNVELLNSPVHQKRVLSSKASGEPPLLLAASVHCAIREAIRAARRDLPINKNKHFRMDSPATMDVIKSLCGLDNVECYLKSLSASTKQ
ncbi:hypothetical protein KI387_018416 [Taxus chinensis]|uniref:Aldehyde oxidase/xanthine dehydrogenase second molybdopterin binding domain-containing protein n=1 Tax=Taxus chinensis TaxID=29808 RepID=A0AA38GJZ8_TAXCH|nr:hypothetical protein KI387_018416 [Taxus chinensis]